MSTNPYRPPANKSSPQSMEQLLSFCVAGLWLFLPIGTLLVRRTVLRTLEDFGVQFPMATQLVLSMTWISFLGMLALAVTVAVAVTPAGKTRRIMLRFCFAVAVLLVLFSAFAIIAPLIALRQSLMA